MNVQEGQFFCSFCHVRHNDWKEHRLTDLHQEKAEGVRRSIDTYQGEQGERGEQGES